MATKPISDDVLCKLGEDFAQRIRRGEHPSISQFTSDYPPDQADEIREFLASIAMLEDVKGGDDVGAAQRVSDPIPENFGRYRIERTLGEGGMGTVYLALDSQLNRKVALKIPKFSANADSTLIERFYREARSSAILRHSHICPIYDVDELDGVHYISMAYIEGHLLSDYINPRKLPPIAVAVRIVRKLAIALHEAHTQGIVHRDLKPANVMIDRRNEPIVMDFGLARLVDVEDDEDLDWVPSPENATPDTTNVKVRLTQEGATLGSPGYMSPEQIRGPRGDVGPASDIFSLGVLLYELLTGELPFHGDGSLRSIVMAVLGNDTPPDAPLTRRNADPQLVSICKKALAKEVEDRYESMQAFAKALTDFLKSNAEVPVLRPVPESQRGTTRRFYPVVSVSIVVIGLLAGVIIAGGFFGDVENRNAGNLPSVVPPKADSTPGDEAVEPHDSASTTATTETKLDRVGSDSTAFADASDVADGPEKRVEASIDGHLANSPVIHRLLQDLDSDDDGKISKVEWANNIQKLPPMSPPRRAAVSFVDYDRNPQDGFLDADEFERMVRDHPRSSGRGNWSPPGFGPPRP